MATTQTGKAPAIGVAGYGHGQPDNNEYTSTHSQALPHRTGPPHNIRESQTPSTVSSLTPDASRTSSFQRKSIPKSWGRPPTPPHKEDRSSDTVSGDPNHESFQGRDNDSIYSHMRSRNLSRAGSIYSISRVSFTIQITQLTSIQLPEASSLSESISAIPTAPKAARALSDAAGQIQSWINKASEVLDGLQARDDVEWAAQAGREGLKEVDGAISRFDTLIQVYVTAVEQLQMREDAGSIPPHELQDTVQELDMIVKEWKKIKTTLQSVKKQVEYAMHWEEMRTATFENIAQECEKLSRQIFEMEEQRHKIDSELPTEPTVGLDLTELEDMLENKPGSPNTQKRNSHRYSFPPAQTSVDTSQSPPPAPKPGLTQDDNNLLGIFARMQPLRAELDFLPMKISSFKNSAESIFPTACSELEEQRDYLEGQWRKLESDAESLRKELGEDRWLLVFRNAAKQALKMIDSVERSITKLDESLDSNTQLRHAPATLKKVENYETKKQHYCPAIERVIAIVDRGVKDRLTVNGEIIRLQNEVQSKWRTTLADVKNMDSTLEAFDATKTQQLRDSVSSLISNDQSLLSSHIDSLGSSPPSSFGIPSRGISRSRPSEDTVQTPSSASTRPRQASTTSTSSATKSTTPASKRFSSLPVPVTPGSTGLGHRQRPAAARTGAQESTPSPSTARTASSTHLSPRTPSAMARPTSRMSNRAASSTASSSNKPRWNASTSMSHSPIGHNFRPLAVTDESPYRKIVTPIKYTPLGASRRQSSLNPTTPGSTPHSRRTSATYSAASPSPALQPRSASRANRPSSLVIGQSVLGEGPGTPGSEAVESPTSTVTGGRPETALMNRATGPGRGAPPRAGSVATVRPMASRTRITSAGKAKADGGGRPAWK